MLYFQFIILISAVTACCKVFPEGVIYKKMCNKQQQKEKTFPYGGM